MTLTDKDKNPAQATHAPPTSTEDLAHAPENDEAGAEGHPVTPAVIAAVRAALDSDDGDTLRAMVEPLHAADVADLIAYLEQDERRALVGALSRQLDPKILSELDEALRADIFNSLDPEAIAAAVAQLDTDDAVDVLEDLDEERRQEVLEVIPSEDRAALEEGLSYPEDSAGRLMRRELVAVPQFWSVGQTLDYLRGKDDLPDEFHEIFIIDPRFHPAGTVGLYRILRSQRDVLMQELMDDSRRLIPVTMDQEEVAYLFKQYNLMSAAVVDGQGRLVGVITVDDVVDVIQEEADEDILALGGVAHDDIYDSALGITRRRLPWLFVNLGTGLLAATVISFFGASIEELVALAILMPIVATMGGSAGTQTMTVAVRALATRELIPANSRRTLRREVLVNFMNAVALSATVGTAVAWWFDSLLLGVILGTALIANLVVAGIIGVLIPVTLHRLRIDPAIASGVLLTTITDVFGFFAFLGLAAWIIL